MAVINFSDESCRQEFLYLVRNGLVSVWSKYSPLLLYRAHGCIHVQFMADDRGVDARHIFLRSCKDVCVVFEEFNKSLPHPSIHLRANASCFF